MQQIEKRKVKKSDGAKIAPDPAGTEDRVAADIKGAKEFVKNLPQKIKSDSDSSKQPGDEQTSKGLPINLNSKALKILIIVAGVFIALLVVGKIFQILKNGGTNSGQPVVIEEATPVPTVRYEISVTPGYGESVYANDPEIIAIEEELDILRNEISTTSLRESLLIPPTLDLNISF